MEHSGEQSANILGGTAGYALALIAGTNLKHAIAAAIS